MKEWRKKQEHKAYEFYVKSKKYKQHVEFNRPAFVIAGNRFGIKVNRYYFTDATSPSETGDCIYVDKQSAVKYGRVFRKTDITRNTAWNSTSVSCIWSRWH